MALSTAAKTYSLRAPTAYRKQTVATLGIKRPAKVLVAAPLVAGLVPSSALAFGKSNVASFQVKSAPDSTGIGTDKKFAIAIFKYTVPPNQNKPFEDAFNAAKDKALANPPPGLSDFTFFQESNTSIYFSVAIFDQEQQGRDFIGSDFGKAFIKQITDLGVQFDPNGAVFKG